jgi:hypothetical protein
MINISQQNFILIGLIIFSLYLLFIEKENLEPTCNNQSTAADQSAELGKSAKEACNKISSRADEIEAEYKGKGQILKNLPFAALFNPNNYKAGDNKTEDVMRNIINTNLSECEVQKIESDCKNSSSSVNVNLIDNSNCEYCKTNLCTISEITQENVAIINQSCTLQSAMESLSKKTDSLDAQALTKVLQKAQGVLSGENTFKKENCSFISTDLSTAKYLEDKKNCANNLQVDQKNSLLFCGNASKILQKNQFDAYQKCLQESSSFSDATFESDKKIKDDTSVDQTSTGIENPFMSSIIASVSSAVVLIVGLLVAMSVAKDKGVQETILKASQQQQGF